MQEKYTKVVRGENTVYKFYWKDPYSSYSVQLEVDNTGNPIFASYGSDKERYSKCTLETGFNSTVKRVMRDLFVYNRKVFKNLKMFLNEEYYEMAENVKILPISE